MNPTSPLFIRTSTLVAILLLALNFTARADYFQGFETDNSGWFTPTRVASGTDGIPASSGGFFAQATTDFTRYGGYSSTFGGGFDTSLDIYLKFGATNDTRFDWDNAINNSSGNFLRDFVFNAGFYNNTDVTGTGDRFVINTGNNAGRGNSNPEGAGAASFVITNEGWYTFKNAFRNVGGFLQDTMSIYDSSNVLLHTWTVGGATDPIASVGGNRYGWFPTDEFSYMAIDNSSLTAVPEASTWVSSALMAGALGVFAFRRRKAIA